jgi:hypothetical protein
LTKNKADCQALFHVVSKSSFIFVQEFISAGTVTENGKINVKSDYDGKLISTKSVHRCHEIESKPRRNQMLAKLTANLIKQRSIMSICHHKQIRLGKNNCY